MPSVGDGHGENTGFRGAVILTNVFAPPQEGCFQYLTNLRSLHLRAAECTVLGGRIDLGLASMPPSLVFLTVSREDSGRSDPRPPLIIRSWPADCPQLCVLLDCRTVGMLFDPTAFAARRRSQRHAMRASWPQAAAASPGLGFQGIKFHLTELPLPLPHDHSARLAIPVDPR